MRFSGSTQCVQGLTLGNVCDLTWSHFALENYLGSLPQSFHSAITKSIYCIALQIILWNNYEMYETALAQAICITELKM